MTFFDKIIKTEIFHNMKFDLTCHWRSHRSLLCLKFNFFLNLFFVLNLIYSKLSHNDNIFKTLTFDLWTTFVLVWFSTYQDGTVPHIYPPTLKTYLKWFNSNCDIFVPWLFLTYWHQRNKILHNDLGATDWTILSCTVYLVWALKIFRQWLYDYFNRIIF